MNHLKNNKIAQGRSGECIHPSQEKYACTSCENFLTLAPGNMTESVNTEKVGCAVAVGQLAPHQNDPDKRKEKKREIKLFQIRA